MAWGVARPPPLLADRALTRGGATRTDMRVVRADTGRTENRHVSATDFNEHSSRSHTILQLVIESRERTPTGAAGSTHVSHLVGRGARPRGAPAPAIVLATSARR